MKTTSTCIWASMLFSLGACAADTSTEASSGVAADEQQLLAKVDVAGGTAKFLGVDQDTLLVVTDTVDEMTPLADPALRGMDVSQIYTYWSGEPAPDALRKYTTRLEQTASDATTATDSQEDGPVAATKAALTGPEFANKYCGTSGYCWLNRTGTWEHQQRARFFMGWVDSVRGDMTVQLRRRTIRSWKSEWVYDVPSGHVIGTLRATSHVINKRDLKFKIFNADGDVWHLYAYWQ